jgi:hypothetical protein
MRPYYRVVSSSLPAIAKRPDHCLTHYLVCAGTLYPSPQALDEDHPLSLAQREDLKAAGVALLETVICALAEGGPSAATTSEALQRLLCDVFGGDVRAFRCFASLWTY